MKPILLSVDSDLDPFVRKSCAQRLWQMLQSRTGATREQFKDVFARGSLLPKPGWDEDVAERRAEAIWPTLKGRHVVFLGEGVRRIMGVPNLHPWVHPLRLNGACVRCLPNASRANQWYYYLPHREAAAMLLEELYSTYLVEQARARRSLELKSRQQLQQQPQPA